MDRYQEDAEVINDKIEEISLKLREHKEKLINVFKEAHQPKHDLILSEYDEIINNWKVMVEAQRTLLNGLKQETLLNSIQIIGLPEQYGRDTEGVAAILSRLLHISIHPSYIKSFERMGNIIPGSNSGQPRALVVELITRNIKHRILTVAETVVLSVIGSDIPMYIVEHLTPENEQLFKKARQEALQQHIDNVWVKDGRIYVRRGDNTFTHEIRREADIAKMAHY